MLESNFSQGYVFSYLLKTLPILIRSPNIIVQPFFHGTSPSTHSKSALLLPMNTKDTYGIYTISTLLSILSCNYTTRLYQDLNIDEVETILLEDPHDSELVKKCFELTNKGKTALVFSIQGYGELSDLFFEWPIFIKSYRSIIHLTSNYSQELSEVKAQFRDYSIEITLDNDEGKGLVLADDDQTGFWIASGIGFGNLDTPLLSDVEEGISGRNALRIDVLEGMGEENYAQWQISHVYNVPQNWSSYDFLTLYWYGHGDGSRYVLILLCPGEKNFFFYQFEDCWKGWRKVLIPLRLPEGFHEISGVKIWKGSVGSPSLDEIKKILLKLSPQNPNLTGTWFLDRIALEKGVLAKLKVQLPKKI
ncbi:MAG TPA: hypothetical protein EYP68_01280, partial [Candidatus Korarchaeota archaeon]|nr:hypothetical protein [Candidatus Korarchaeota archaeon]